MGSDRILTEADYIRIKAECEERRAKIDPRNVYTVSYEAGNQQITEKVLALSTKEAEEHVKQQCGLVGWIPSNFKIINTKLAATS